VLAAVALKAGGSTLVMAPGWTDQSGASSAAG